MIRICTFCDVSFYVRIPQNIFAILCTLEFCRSIGIWLCIFASSHLRFKLKKSRRKSFFFIWCKYLENNLKFYIYIYLFSYFFLLVTHTHFSLFSLFSYLLSVRLSVCLVELCRVHCLIGL